MELCNLWELENGYSAHKIGFSILIYKDGKPWLQVDNIQQLHETIRINSQRGGNNYGKN